MFCKLRIFKKCAHLAHDPCTLCIECSCNQLFGGVCGTPHIGLTIFIFTAWIQPVSKMEVCIPQIFLAFQTLLGKFLFIFRHMCRYIFFHIIHPFLHHLKAFLENGNIFVSLIKCPWNYNCSISPSCRSICAKSIFLHGIVSKRIRNDHWNQTIFKLFFFHISEPFFQELFYILIECGCFSINKNVSCPSGFFTLRTVCWDGKHISTLAPLDIGLQLVQFFIRCTETSCHFQVCSDHDSLYIFRCKFSRISGNLHITETMEGELRFKHFFSISPEYKIISLITVKS